MVIGIDEVGRGCLAGDVLTCAFATRHDLAPDELARLRAAALDSKAFSSREKRERAAAVLAPLGRFRIARASIDEIEALNIRGATLLAMRRAWRDLVDAFPDLRSAEVLIDGKDVPPGLPAGTRAVIAGDASVAEISCASVLAKVARDREMVALDARHPGYGFASNAGYGSAAHREAIRRLGMSRVHRSWARKFAG